MPRPIKAELARIEADLWLRQADAGRLYIPLDIASPVGDIILDHLTWWRQEHRERPLALYIGCGSGDNLTDLILEAIERLDDTTAYADMAVSAGLEVTMACKHRVASPRAKFAYHGLADVPKPGQAKRGHRTDEMQIEWMLERLVDKAERDMVEARAFWTAKTASGDLWEFGAEEAKELGIIHEIGEDDDA